MTPLLSRKEVARLLNVSPRTIARWTVSGALRPVRLSSRAVRYDLADVSQLIVNALPNGKEAN